MGSGRDSGAGKTVRGGKGCLVCQRGVGLGQVCTLKRPWEFEKKKSENPIDFALKQLGRTLSSTVKARTLAEMQQYLQPLQLFSQVKIFPNGLGSTTF